MSAREMGQQQTSRPQRFVIEGTWSGYTSRQTKVVHRSVHKGSFKRLRAWAERAGSVWFTDGTRLDLVVRDCEPRERVAVIHGYDQLIADCAYYDVDSVVALANARAEARDSVVTRHEVQP